MLSLLSLFPRHSSLEQDEVFPTPSFYRKERSEAQRHGQPKTTGQRHNQNLGLQSLARCPLLEVMSAFSHCLALHPCLKRALAFINSFLSLCRGEVLEHRWGGGRRDGGAGSHSSGGSGARTGEVGRSQSQATQNGSQDTYVIRGSTVLLARKV